MRFLANENFPGDAVAALVAAGHDVVWIRIAAPGSKDDDILAWAVRERRVLLTFDKDFGELAWRVGLPASSGIVLFRLPMPAAAAVGVVLAAYPSTTLHHVAAVTRGARLAAVGWARSFIRDAAQRELLFDLDTARRALFAREGKSAEFDLIAKSLSNLIRMWAED